MRSHCYAHIPTNIKNIRNMKIIQEEKAKRHSIYHLVTIDDAGAVLEDQAFDYRVVEVKDDGQPGTLILLDENGDVVADPTQYLATNRRLDAPATRRQVATALCLLHVHARLCGYDIRKMTTTNIKDLTAFLSGVTVHPYNGGQTTFRTASSVNNAYSMIKQYVLDRGFENSAFNIRRSTAVETNIQGINITTIRFYDPNRLRTNPLYGDTPPMHLTPMQAETLIQVIKDAGDEQTYLAVNLQLRTGLRPGELLGITLEDFKVHRHFDGSEDHYVLLRNRCSDHGDQYCKRLYHPKSTEEYRHEAYHRAKVWEVPVTKKIRDGIVGAFEAFRAALPAAKRKTFEDNVRADAVDVRGVKVPPENYYVFHGGHLGRLSQQTYNNHLKRYFEAIGVPVDRGTKTTNCAHKIRHSFAMYHAQYSPNPKNPEELRVLMRHASVASIQPYYTPLREDVLKAVRECAEMMAEAIPSLDK